jgi:hypothetical protein
VQSWQEKADGRAIASGRGKRVRPEVYRNSSPDFSVKEGDEKDKEE